jgi:hypothetical protein
MTPFSTSLPTNEQIYKLNLSTEVLPGNLTADDAIMAFTRDGIDNLKQPLEDSES